MSHSYVALLPAAVPPKIAEQILKKGKSVFGGMVGVDAETEIGGCFLGNEFQVKDGGPHTIEQIIECCEYPPGLRQPHNRIIYKWVPDEDCRHVTNADAWSVICSNSVVTSPKCIQMWWGMDQVFQSAFIMVRSVQGEMYPFEEDHADFVLKYMLGRQGFWKEKFEESNYHKFDTLDGLISDLKNLEK